ncbi:MAG TPA: thiamine phosphate synthase [Chthoniobacterales bacterium]|nr:thiamine phosphate synthase [Chthoniobacterales bacterium]
MRNLSDCRLYGILDLAYTDASNAVHVIESMIEGGVDVIQLRGKQQSIDRLIDLAGQLHEITLAASVPFIVNDFAEIARRVPVEGVHVGQDDDLIAHVRKKAGREIIIGKSTHGLEQAAAARNEGADYIGFGPIFATPTKPDYTPIGVTGIKRVHHEVALPIFCIGGIKLENLAQVIAAGAERVVIVSGLLQANDIAKYARACRKLLAPGS